MIVVKKDISKNFDRNKPKNYDRIVYNCKMDDIWINIETPVK